MFLGQRKWNGNRNEHVIWMGMETRLRGVEYGVGCMRLVLAWIFIHTSLVHERIPMVLKQGVLDIGSFTWITLRRCSKRILYSFL